MPSDKPGHPKYVLYFDNIYHIANPMISSYRLGDLVLLSLTEQEQDEILVDFPNSIGSKYIIEKRKNPNGNNMDIITQLVMNCLEQNEGLFPADISESTMIHLRLGDVIAGTAWHEKQKRPLSKDDIKQLLKGDENKKYVMGKCFFAKPSSTNYNECIRHSELYLQTILCELNAEHFDSGNADVDLCCAIKAKLFVQGRGYFSKLIVDIRNRFHLPNIETMVATA